MNNDEYVELYQYVVVVAKYNNKDNAQRKERKKRKRIENEDEDEKEEEKKQIYIINKNLTQIVQIHGLNFYF